MVTFHEEGSQSPQQVHSRQSSVTKSEAKSPGASFKVQKTNNRFLKAKSSVGSDRSFRVRDDVEEPLLSPTDSDTISPGTTISQDPLSPMNKSEHSLFDRYDDSFIMEAVEDEENYWQAVVHVLNAVLKRNDLIPQKGRLAHFAHKFTLHFNFVFSYAVLVLIVMTFFEVPLWCKLINLQSGEQKCTNSSVWDAEYPMSGLPFMSRSLNFGVELGLLIILLIELLFQFVAFGIKRTLQDNQLLLNFVLLLLYVIEFSYAYATPYSWIRFAQYIRVLLFVNRSPDVRQQVRLFVKILPRFLAIALIVFLYISAFAFIGVLLLKNMHWQDTVQDRPWHDYFRTMGHAYWSLMVLLTTCNYPDVAIQAYSDNRLSFFFFFFFSVGGIFFLVNFATAVVYNTYTEQDQVETESGKKSEEQNLRRAFDLIDEQGKGHISFGQFMVLAHEMRQYRRLAGAVKGDGARIMFAILDFDGSQVLSFDNFRMLVSVIHMRFEKIGQQTFFERKYPQTFRSPVFQTFKRIVLSDYFEYGMILILLIMGALTVWEEWTDIIGRETDPKRVDNQPDSFWNIIELLFTIIFVVEATVKILALGWKVYIREDKFEFFVAVLSVVVTIIIYIPTDCFNDTIIIRYTILLRLIQALQLLSAISAPGLLRLVRLLTTIQYFQLFYLTVINMIPNVVKLTKMLFCIMFFYSAVGVDIYGGIINKDEDRVQYAILNGTDYGQAGYWAMNMNDMGGAMVVFFEMLIVNNWHLFVSGFVAVTSFWTYYFFISFFALGVIMGLNIVTSFVIDTFSREYDAQARTLELSNGAAKLERDEAVFDASIITGTKTGIQGTFRAKVVGKFDSHSKQEMLLSLFEQKLGIDVGQLEDLENLS